MKMKAEMFFRIQGGIGNNSSAAYFSVDENSVLSVKNFTIPAYISNPEHAFRWVSKRSEDRLNNFANIAKKNMSIVRIVVPFWLCALFYRNAINNINPFQKKKVHICDLTMSGVSFGLKDVWLELLCESALFADHTILDTPERINEVLTSCLVTSSFPQREYDREKVSKLLQKLDLSQEDIILVKDCDPKLNPEKPKESRDMTKYDNIRIFEDTMQVIKNSKIYCELTEKAKASTKLYEKPENIVSLSRFEEPVQICVTSERSIECALRLLPTSINRVAVLNFASPKHPGGGVVTGASAQEEAICRITNLYPCLQAMQMRGIFYNTKLRSPYTDSVLYTCDVAVIKTDEENPELLVPNIDEEKCPVLIDVVTCAAPNQSGIAIPDEDLYAIIRRRLNIVLSACVENGAETLVLGAWGCGAFRNPPEVVAKGMLDEIKENFNFSFRQIIFAVYSPKGNLSNNYLTFKRIISEEDKNKPN